MDPGGDSGLSRDVNKGKQVAAAKRRRRRVSHVLLNVGDTYMGMPQTATTAGGAGTSSSTPVAPGVAHSPFGSNWYPLNPSSTPPAYGYFMGPTSGYMGPPPEVTGAPSGYMPHPMGPPFGYMPHTMGTQAGHASTPIGLSMPTPEVQPDQPLQNDGSNSDDTDPDGQADMSQDSEPEEEVRDPIDGRLRKVIYPLGDAFYRSKTGSSAITFVLKKLYFKEYHRKLKSIEKEKKEDYVKLFRSKVTWKPEYDQAVRRLFWIRMAKQLSDLLYKLRRADVRPRYMSEEVWNKYKDFWKSDEFKSKGDKAKKNRNSEKGGSLHSCGSINASEHAKKLSKKAGRSLTISELHKATHMKKDKVTYVDERSRRAQEEHTRWMSELLRESWDAEKLGPLDPKIIAMANRHWLKLVGGFNKNRLYGAGPLASTLNSEDHLDTMGASSSQPPRTSHEDEQLAQHGQQIQHMMSVLEQVMAQQREILEYHKSQKAKESKSDAAPVSNSSESESDDGSY